MFLNISNHPSKLWGERQLRAAQQYGKIIDISFPQISSESTSSEIDQLVTEYLEKIRVYQHPVVMVQGEFVFTFRLVTALKKEGYTVLAGVSDRKTTEIQREDGTSIKTAEFVFRGFRVY